MLLRFVTDQAERAKRKGNDEEEEEEDVKYTRKWYMPWKKVKVASQNKKVRVAEANTLHMKR